MPSSPDVSELHRIGKTAIRQMGSGKRPVNDNLGAWLEMLSSLHARLSPELRDIARQLECDRGKFVRRPCGIRPLTDVPPCSKLWRPSMPPSLCRSAARLVG
jgi:hypothetical protein